MSVDKKTEELLPVAGLTNADLVMVVQASESKRASMAQLKAFFGAAANASGLANVNSYLNEGDTNYDGAISRCLAANNHAYFPAKPTLTDPNNFYRTSATIALGQGQSLMGDGPGVSKIVCDSAAAPVVTLGNNIFWYGISGLTLAHGVTAVAGGDGIFQGQGATAWVDNCAVDDVLLVANYNGANLGKAFSGRWTNVLAIGNVYDGFRMTTNGASTVNGEARAGPLQTVFIGCGARSNGHDGFAYYSTESVPAGSSMGTLVDCETYANGHHGVSAIGLASHPMHSIRIDGGFFGEDLGHGIYLDTYAANHTLMPQFLEAAGGSNIYLTANNRSPVIRLGVCQSAYNDGILSVGAIDVQIEGGLFVNNGRNPGAGLTWAGIRIDGGSAMISGIRAYDTGSGLQDFGVSAPAAGVFITSSRLDGNASAPIAWGATPTTSVASGCFPASANTGGTTISGDVTITGNLNVSGKGQVNSLGVGMAASATAGTISATSNINLQTTGNISGVKDMGITGDVTMTTGSLYLNGTAAGQGVFVCRAAKVANSLGVGTDPDSTVGRIVATDAINIGTPTGGYKSGGLNVPTGVYVNNVAVGAGAISGDLTITGNLTVSGTARANSLGVGMAASATTGTINATSSINLQTTGDISGVRNMGVTGDVTLTTGSLYLNGTAAGQGVFVCRAAKVVNSLGVGVDPSGTTGRVDASTVAASSSLSTGGSFAASSLSLSGPISGVTSLNMSGDLTVGGSVNATGAITSTTSYVQAASTVYGSAASFTGNVSINGGNLNLNSAGNISGVVNMGVVGDVTMTQGMLYLNGTGAGKGGVVAQSVALSGSLGVGTAAASTAGRIDATTIYRAGTPL